MPISGGYSRSATGSPAPPGFAFTTIATLALGIGAKTAIFGVVNGVLLRPLRYPHPEQLEFITTGFRNSAVDQFWMSPPEFLEFRDDNSMFQSVGAYTTAAANLGTDPAMRPTPAAVTPKFKPTLGVRPTRRPCWSCSSSRARILGSRVAGAGPPSRVCGL
jgi:hypothetical protein